MGIRRPLRQLAQARGVVIPSNPKRSSHGKPPPVCHGESHPPRFGNPPRESLSWGPGISHPIVAKADRLYGGVCVRIVNGVSDLAAIVWELRMPAIWRNAFRRLFGRVWD